MLSLFRKKKLNKTVYVGLSGGVDSAVSAALLLEKGYKVKGVFIRVWQPDWIECSAKEDEREAMRVASHLDIPFQVLDLEKEYKHGVIDYMIEEYRQGRTPNPDVMCNREVKFGAFLRWALKDGADFVATGHYANVVKNGDIYELHKGIDENKDQSYFLWTLNQEQLKHTMFPIGNITKPNVRKLAEKFHLPNAKRKDSQGLCFIGKIDIKDFLQHYIKSEKGRVLDTNGNTIGSHDGATLFTIGERRGFTITEKSPNDTPLFVVDKDIEGNTITVSPKDPTIGLSSRQKSVSIEKINWIDGTLPKIQTETGYPYDVRPRYRQKLEKARINNVYITETTFELEKELDTLTPGQSLVIYEGSKCLGGGIITE